ncbi:hypothetical protein MJO28_007428 [Puccinia striiformis f. sp. tritici]|uniref:Uncharacterized protein n=1 Tax=Puccinia striiformis f. sp. tritici TaxID=168172 RepID=A0ACC0EEF5_9BASI|nr:hypothetical protein MJO28_007428 [Puccinia striiformis f. sp. tritici]
MSLLIEAYQVMRLPCEMDPHRLPAPGLVCSISHCQPISLHPPGLIPPKCSHCRSHSSTLIRSDGHQQQYSNGKMAKGLSDPPQAS